MVTQTHIQTRSEAAEASQNKLLTTPQAARSLGIGKRTLQELVAARKIAVIRFGRNTRFDPADLDAFVEANKVKAAGWKGGSR